MQDFLKEIDQIGDFFRSGNLQAALNKANSLVDTYSLRGLDLTEIKSKLEIIEHDLGALNLDELALSEEQRNLERKRLRKAFQELLTQLRKKAESPGAKNWMRFDANFMLNRIPALFAIIAVLWLCFEVYEWSQAMNNEDYTGVERENLVPPFALLIGDLLVAVIFKILNLVKK